MKYFHLNIGNKSSFPSLSFHQEQPARFRPRALQYQSIYHSQTSFLISKLNSENYSFIIPSKFFRQLQLHLYSIITIIIIKKCQIFIKLQKWPSLPYTLNRFHEYQISNIIKATLEMNFRSLEMKIRIGWIV